MFTIRVYLPCVDQQVDFYMEHLVDLFLLLNITVISWREEGRLCNTVMSRYIQILLTIENDGYI